MTPKTLALCLLAFALLVPPVAAGDGHGCILSVSGAPATAISSGGNTATQIVTLNCPDSTERVGEPRVTYNVTANGIGGSGVGGLDNAPPTVDYLGRTEDPSSDDLPREVQALLNSIVDDGSEVPGDKILPGIAGIDLGDLANLNVVGEDRWQDQWAVMVPNLSTYRVSFCVDLDVDGDGVADCELCVAWGQWH